MPTRLPDRMVRHRKSPTTGRPSPRDRLDFNDLPCTSLSIHPLEPFLRSNLLSRHRHAQGATPLNLVRKASQLRQPCRVLYLSFRGHKVIMQTRLEEQASVELELTVVRLQARVPAPHTRALAKQADWTSVKDPWASLFRQPPGKTCTR